MSNEPKSAPEYGRLRNFWEARTDVNSSTEKPSALSNGSSVKQVYKSTPTTNNTDNSTYNQNNHQSSNNGLTMESTPLVLEFEQDIVGGSLAEFLSAAEKLGGEIAEHARLVKNAFAVQRDFLAVATRCVKPSDSDFQKLLGDTAKAISDIQTFREQRRSSAFFNHLSGVSDSIPALAWVTVSPTPGPYVKEMNDAGQFYTNRVLKDFKDKPGHADWAKAWVNTLVALQSYIKKNHTTGLVWGKEPFTGVSGGPPSTGGPPPPPPPPTYEMDFESMSISNDEKAALFQELNQGEGVTKGLKKVTADMQTHKNPNLRSGGVVHSAISKPGSTFSASKGPSDKPSKFVLEGKKWVVEYHVGKKDLKIDEVELNQVVYMFGCKDSTLQIKGKMNSIVIDSCVKTAIVFDSLLASVEFVNCRDCQMQVMGTVPTVTIDKVDGLQVFLSKESLSTEIVSAKSSALNVMVPKPDGEYVEWPIPEQFKTTIGEKGLITTATETVGV